MNNLDISQAIQALSAKVDSLSTIVSVLIERNEELRGRVVELECKNSELKAAQELNKTRMMGFHV